MHLTINGRKTMRSATECEMRLYSRRFFGSKHRPNLANGFQIALVLALLSAGFVFPSAYGQEPTEIPAQEVLAPDEEAAEVDATPADDPAAEDRTIASDADAADSAGVMSLLVASGWIGVIIAALSVAAVAMILENLVSIRRGALMPRGLPQDLHAAITANEFSKAEQACKQRPSYLAYVVLAGLQEVRINYEAVEKAMEDASQEQANRLFRKVENLSLIGNIAPMLGLLGTVYGLVLAFKKVAETPGAGPAELADGIYLALITTVMGLVVSIPALSAYSIFRSRIEQLASEVNVLSEQIFINYKRSRLARRSDG